MKLFFYIALLALVNARRQRKNRDKQASAALSWAKAALNKVKNINNTYYAELSNSTSNTVRDIYDKLDNLTGYYDRLFDHISRIDMAIVNLERKVDQIWTPTPDPRTTAYPIRTYNRIMVMAGDEPSLPSDIITIDTGVVKSFRVTRPTLQWHCLQNFYGNLYALGGRHTEHDIYKLDERCQFKKMSLQLPRGYINHECAVHDEVLYLCPDWALGTTCVAIQSDLGKLSLVGEIPLDKPRFASTLVSTYRGLMIIGGKKTPTTALLKEGRFQEGPRLPVPIAQSAACEIKRNIYIIGGYNFFNNQALSSILVLKEGSDYWLKIGDLSSRRFGLAVMSMENRESAWIIGGGSREKLNVFVGNATRMDSMGWLDRRPGSTAALVHDDICVNIY